MFQNTLGCILIFTVSVLLAWPLGAYMNRVYSGNPGYMNSLKLLENFLFRNCRIDPLKEMNWKQYLIAMLIINSVWFVFAFIMLLFQGNLFLNPARNPSMEWSLAFNSAISFLTSTNLQHYAGETGATYLSQLGVFMFLQFLSAATSLAAGVAVVRGLAAKTNTSLGNFYSDFVLSITRILLPISVITAIIFICSGVPMTFHGPVQIKTFQGDSSTVATGPVAAFLPIKELGANGGGFFGANDAHPFENPNFFSFIVHSIIVFLLPMAFIFFISYNLKSKKFAAMIFTVMTLGFILITVPIVHQEVKGNPAIAAMAIHNTGNIEGKEVRFGPFYSGYYAGENAAIPAGTTVGSVDSYMPISSLFMLLGMYVDGFFGGLGTGWINMFIILIIAIFVGGLMIGRTPELFGKKIGIKEMQITVLVAVLMSLVPLVLTAISCFTYVNYTGGNESLQWLSNKGSHGFTTMLYEYISSVAGNGSDFGGLGNNTVFWNLTTSFAMLTGRFIPIIGALWIAGLLIEKQYIPPSHGTIKVEGLTFSAFLFAVIIVLNVLSLFPSLILGPVFERYLH
ncbi:MAG: potassium-transporting ATPase subunit KdpA [Bacteroidia bacterium]